MWCKYLNLNTCIRCNKNDQIHQGDGLCVRCYSHRRRRQKKEIKEKKYDWSYDWPCCQICKTIERPHIRKGLCKQCDARETHRKKVDYTPTKSGWSQKYENCLKCKTIETPYESNGLCCHCYSKHRYTKPEYLIYKREYAKRKSQEDIHWKLKTNLRNRLRCAIKNNQKGGSAVKDLGCSIEEFKQWIEQQFYPNPKTGEIMTWENWKHDGWHLDHIIPLSQFDLNQSSQIRKACHWFNLQPLWAEENFQKSDKQDVLGVPRH